MTGESELLQLIAAFMANPEVADELDFPPDDPKIRLTRTSESRVEMRQIVGDAGGREMALFEPSSERPDDLSADVPFLPEQTAIVVLHEHVRMVMWPAADGDSLEALLDQSLQAGWETPEVEQGRPLTVGTRLRRGQDERVLMTLGVGVQILDRLA